MTTQNKYTTTRFLGALAVLFLILMGTAAKAQEQTDSLIINVGKSKIIFLINDRDDLATMENYDLDAILKQLSMKLNADSSAVVTNSDGTENVVSDTTIVIPSNEPPFEQDEEDDEPEVAEERKKGSTNNYINFDLGTNNFLSNGNFPDASGELYTVRPFGSWYVGVSSTYQTYFGKNFSIEWGPSLTWYNFKFQNDAVRIMKDGDQTVFVEETTIPNADFKKSKLTIAYVNASVVPVFSFGRAHKDRSKINWPGKADYDIKTNGKSFRLGLGGYAGYRIASYSKFVYDDGGKEKDKDKDNFYLNNFRYGLRLQMGYGGTDLFFNYDMNELFSEGKGPKLNAFSFGIIL